VNHGLQSDGRPVRSVRARVRDGNGGIVLVDTPGFYQHPEATEVILDDIYDWLR